MIHSSLFTFNFREMQKHRGNGMGTQIKWLKRMAGIISGMFLFVMIVRVLNYMYVEDEDWGRLLWHSFYEEAGKIDNLYLGSSHVYWDLDPYQLDRLNGQWNFNLASSGQSLEGTYFLMREADQYNRLSHVYVELYYGCNAKEEFGGGRDLLETNLVYNWRNTDYMRFSLNRLQYMITMAKPEKYPEVFCGFSRYREYLGNWGYVEQRIERKRSREYIDYKTRYDFDDGAKDMKNINPKDGFIRRKCFRTQQGITNKDVAWQKILWQKQARHI